MPNLQNQLLSPTNTGKLVYQLGTDSTGVNHYRHHTNDSFTTLTLQTNRIERPNLTLMMTSTQVVETSVTTTDNSPSQDYTHPDDRTTLLLVTPGFKPFTVLSSIRPSPINFRPRSSCLYPDSSILISRKHYFKYPVCIEFSLMYPVPVKFCNLYPTSPL